VAHSLSAKKRVRQDAKRRITNRARRRQVKTLVKRFETTLGAGDAKAASEQFHTVVARLDKAGSDGTMHKKTAARKKSRLARRLNALKAKPAGPASSSSVREL
jgi:small subunit ribosomal protein S20